MPTQTAPSSEPATIVITAKPSAGRESEWEQALGDLIRRSLTFPGHLGSTVLRPEKPGAGYRIVTRFDSDAHLKNWQESDIRQKCVGKLRAMESEPPEIVHMSGMETWFDHPATALTVDPPPKFKMAVIVWIALFFIVVPAMNYLRDLTSDMPALYAKAIQISFGVFLMTWIVMPLLSRIFGFWLYPKSGNQLHSGKR